MNIFDNVPQLDEILDVLKFMTPIMREKLCEYMEYAALALAQDSLDQTNRDVERGAFAVISKLKTAFASLKLSTKQDTNK